MQIQVPPGAGLARVSDVSASASCDPRLSGAIHVIDCAEDCNALQASDTTFTAGNLLLEQGAGQHVGNRRSGVLPCSPSAGWHTMRGHASLQPQDFVRTDGPAGDAGQTCPDFSASAWPMRFGTVRQSCGAPGVTVLQGVDHWRVTVWRR